VVIVVRYFAGARAAAGVAEEKVPARTLAELVSVLGERHGERLTAVLTGCSFLVDGLRRQDRDAPLGPDAVVDVLPPFAGG
jgi:molybdopterin synthase sulfur carrier subunit